MHQKVRQKIPFPLQDCKGHTGDDDGKNCEQCVHDVVRDVGFRREAVEGRTCGTEVGDMGGREILFFELLGHGADNSAKMLMTFVDGIAEARKNGAAEIPIIFV